MKPKIQVEEDHYKNKYDSLERFSSYFYQIDSIIKTRPKSILEIGVGNKTIYNYLKNLGLEIISCDFDKGLKPDIVGDIRKLPVKQNSFDTVVAFEVLEHIPFNDFEKSIIELKRVSKKYVIISIPSPSVYFFPIIKINIPFFRKKNISLFFRITPFFIKFKPTKEHYWEMGFNQTTKRDVRKILKKHFKITKEICSPLNPYHYFFILKK